MGNNTSSSAYRHRQTARISTLHQRKYCYLGCPNTYQSELPRSFQSQVRRNEFIVIEFKYTTAVFPSSFLHLPLPRLLHSTDASFRAENRLELEGCRWMEAVQGPLFTTSSKLEVWHWEDGWMCTQ